MQVRLLPEMSAKDFIQLAKETEQRVLAEPNEARKRRNLYLSKIDYDLLTPNDLAMVTNRIFTSTFISLLNDENYVIPTMFHKPVHRGFSDLMFGRASREMKQNHIKALAQINSRIVITKATIDLFDKLHFILFNEKDVSKQKDAILKLEQQLLALKAMHDKDKNAGLLGQPQVSKQTIEEAITRSENAIRSFLVDDQDELKAMLPLVQDCKNEADSLHNQLQSLIKNMGDYPMTICTWFVKVFLAAKKNVNFETTCADIKKKIEDAQNKPEFAQLKAAAQLTLETVKKNAGLIVTPAESKALASSAATLAALAEHKEKSRYDDVKKPQVQESKEIVYLLVEGKENKAKIAAVSYADGKDQKGAYTAGSSALMKAPVKSAGAVGSSPLARSGAQVVARPVG